MANISNYTTEVVINNVTYIIPEIGFDFLDHLAQFGLALEDVTDGTKLISMITAFVAYFTHRDRSAANKLITDHIINGGTLDTVSSAMMEALNKSRFFTALMSKNQTEEAEN